MCIASFTLTRSRKGKINNLKTIFVTKCLAISIVNKKYKNVKYFSQVLLNTLTADDEYSRHNRENLPLPIQVQLSKKPNIFFCFFIGFLESALNFEHFKKN